MSVLVGVLCSIWPLIAGIGVGLWLAWMERAKRQDEADRDH